LRPGLPTDDSVVAGAGDDCAVLDLGLADRYVLFKTDAVVEGVHFTSETPAERIGHKALARNLSDIAAMGGVPTHALVTLGLPKDFQAERIENIYAGLNRLAERHGVAVVGGETTSNPERLFISVSLLGTCSKRHAALRRGAREGDAIFVSGELGGSLAGRHLEFEPRLDQGQWLVRHFRIHAMIDLSDGLAGDLRHILDASGVGAELLSSSIPISREAKLQARQESSAKSPLLSALTDGEDFELLFTVAAQDAVEVLDGWKKEFPGLKLTCIGKITGQPGLTLRDTDGLKPITWHGYTHFQ
jgi:thiamine-monophosphate kinase